ncbi:LysR family transcriptional regulator [Amycolatopsis acidicola]|uniref:LysR family transcriptional regulator n=1 Tax=Amycolatopsis acidicola TaxID=2596893 RepID=A0A5N0UPZ4_9PSEU|nr:LysR family transcriptional regulator [Amycolatopsis acidicola]KAA9153173.1 LysR family transcriptional regulator [Amycolatopsis acidicola]
MELRQVVYFEAVVRCGGFSRAAEQLRIAQPAVSAQIKRLERELGITLLERTTRTVQLTAAGRLFLARAREILAQVEGVRADLDELSAVLRGSLRVGVTQVLGSLELPSLLAGFSRAYPGVMLELRTGLIAQLLAELDAGTVDVVLGPVHADLASRYSAEVLAPEEIVLITPPGGRRVSSLDDVRGEPFVCLPEGSGLHEILRAAARGFEPEIRFQTHSAASIRELVAAGLGVALVAASAARAPGPPVEVHRLDPAPPHPPIGLILLRDKEPGAAARAWADACRVAAGFPVTRPGQP